MKRIILITVVVFSVSTLFAKHPEGYKKRPAGLNKTAAGCNEPTSTIDLDINNVRARILSGGDMWWDQSAGVARYEVPKGGNTNALFAGSVWIGGIDRATRDLKVAAQLFRNGVNDYWTGPLDEANGASIDFQTCANWDRFWKINSADVTNFRNLFAQYLDRDNKINPLFTSTVQNIIDANQSNIPDVIKEWPGRNSIEAVSSTGSRLNVPDKEMAPFVDVDNDNVYNYRNGDYPLVTGDQYIWYIFNDKGDVKTQTQSDAIGLEIHLGAFAFGTADCLNDATFYNYRIFNFNTSHLDSCYMATWTDADMGYAFDDYIGSDSTRGLGVLYNGDGNDEGPTGYGFDIPMVGVDFFRGPRVPDPADATKTIELEMSVFTYFYNGGGPRLGDPTNRNDFYGFMTGSWKDGSRFAAGCNPEQTASVLAGPSVYPDDPCKGIGVNMSDCNIPPQDFRFVHSAGPFVLTPGFVPSDVTIGCIWVPDAGSGKSACFSKILFCDDRAQNLFDADFKLPFGPQAPDLNITPYDKKLVITLTNPSSSNNANEAYGNVDSAAKFREISVKAARLRYPDSLYKFEGYIVYQLRDANVSFSEIRDKNGNLNTDVARIARQSDKKNHIANLLNFEVDPEISADYYKPKLMVEGANEGLKHSFVVTEDAFATSTSKKLINYKTYYFMAIAYAYNKFDNNDVDAPNSTPESRENEFDPNEAFNTQDIQYLESRTDGREAPIRIIGAIPSPTDDGLYTQTYADYGLGIQLTQLEGKGNGGNQLELLEESITEILYGGNNQDYTPTYQGRTVEEVTDITKKINGPVEVFVTNPNQLIPGNYELALLVDSSYAQAGLDSGLGAIPQYTKWVLTNTDNGDTVYGERSIETFNDQLVRRLITDPTNPNLNEFEWWGLSVGLKQVVRPSDNDSIGNNAYITAEVIYDDLNLPWLSGNRDQEGKSRNNWIRSGTQDNANALEDLELGNNLSCPMTDYPEATNGDRVQAYEKLLSGTWAPLYMASNNRQAECGFGLLYHGGQRDNANFGDWLKDCHSVDIVFTSDKSLWTRCPVVEMTENAGNPVSLAEGGAYKFNIREHESWDKGVNSDGTPAYSSGFGMSWFPGYAINVETGERLNVFFSEESYNGVDNGNDMIYNPTSRAFDPVNGDLKWGGKHAIFVQNTKYDMGKGTYDLLQEAKIPPAIVQFSNYTARNTPLLELYKTVMWVGNTLRSPGVEFASLQDGIIPTNTKVRIRVERPYAQYKADPNRAYTNDGWPLYTFSTNNLVSAALGDGRNTYSDDKKKLLDQIQPVPNPYYAYNSYETNRLDNRIKIINLPAQVSIKIYTIDGTLVRTIQKNDPNTNFIDWDLKNNRNLPIASGMYLIHVNIDGIGEKVIKWFGAMRPIDITSF